MRLAGGHLPKFETSSNRLEGEFQAPENQPEKVIIKQRMEQVKGRHFASPGKRLVNHSENQQKDRFFAANLQLAPIVKAAQKTYNFGSLESGKKGASNAVTSAALWPKTRSLLQPILPETDRRNRQVWHRSNRALRRTHNRAAGEDSRAMLLIRCSAGRRNLFRRRCYRIGFFKHPLCQS
jgi:hypothetical protein